MECPKCGHDFDPGEGNEPAPCPQCGVYAHKVGVAPVSARAQATVVSPGRRTRVIAIGLILVLGFLAGAFLYVQWQDDRELAERVAVSCRAADATLVELIDEKDLPTIEVFNNKAPQRIAKLDSLLSNVLAVDSSSDPAYAQVCSDYIRSARHYIRSFSGYINAYPLYMAGELLMGDQKEYASSAEGLEMLAFTLEDLDATQTAMVRRAQTEDDIAAKVQLSIEAGLYIEKVSRLHEYLIYVQETSKNKDAYIEAIKVARKAGADLYRDGQTMEDTLNLDMNLKDWSAVPRYE